MSGVNKRKTITVVGGTYKEFCLEPEWEQIFGSGLRAALAVRGIDSECSVSFYTIAESYVKTHLLMHYADIEKVIFDAPDGASPISFYYENALKPPIYSFNDVDYPRLSVKTNNCVLFGMMEGLCTVDAEYVVYDPQSPNGPIPFSKTDSKAAHLCLILNEQEALAWSGKKTDDEVRDFLFATENCECLVIKKGAAGAIVFDGPVSTGITIPAYKTTKVWTIGSGDVFTSAFSYYWIVAGETPVKSAKMASLATACYSNSKSLEKLGDQLKEADFAEHIPSVSGSVYLAGPFFTVAERMFVNECLRALRGAGLSVFSPYHDVGLGGPDEVVPQDIEAINDCKTIFAILNGMDPGTVFEVGFGVALDKNIVILAENESATNLQMMKGTKCVIESDFVTAIYKTCWLTNE